MNEFIKKLIKKLEEAKNRANRHYNYGDETAYRHAIEIVNQLANESVKGDLISRSAILEWINQQREEVTKKQVAGTKESIFTRENLVDMQRCLSTFETFINNQPTPCNDGWIPVEQRLPEKLEPVNITWVNRKPEPYYAHIKDIPFVATAIYYNEKWWWYSCICEDYLAEYGKSECDAVDKDIDVIAWQPLPQPYKENENE